MRLLSAFVCLSLVSSSAFSETPQGTETDAMQQIESANEITPSCRRSIDDGMRWLIGGIRRGGIGPDVGLAPDLGCTAIAGLALLAEGNTVRGGPHHHELKTLLDSVLVLLRQFPKGHVAGEKISTIQRKIGRNADLFLATLFLTEVIGDAGVYEAETQRALDNLVQIVSSAQGADGTWGDESWAPILGTVLGWECMRSSVSCGMRVEGSARLASEALLRKLQDVEEQSPNGWMHNFYRQASGIRVLYSTGYRDEPAFRSAVDRIIQTARTDHRHFRSAGGEEYLSFFLATECIIQNPEPSWEIWYPTVRDNLINVQNGDGSWTGHHCIVDRTFCTAAALMTLQAPNRFLSVSDL